MFGIQSVVVFVYLSIHISSCADEQLYSSGSVSELVLCPAAAAEPPADAAAPAASSRQNEWSAPLQEEQEQQVGVQMGTQRQ